MDSEEVLADGEVKILTNATLVAKGASVYEVIDETCHDFIKMAERFAQAIGAGFVAVDMFICDHVIDAVLDITAAMLDK